MKYSDYGEKIPQDQRKALNEKSLYLIDSGLPPGGSVTPEDIYNAYTGDGDLHGLNREDYDNYNAFSQAKKEAENGQFFTPHHLCQLVAECLKPSESSLVADLTCGMGNFFNFMPTESNLYGCDIDPKAVKVARFLYPEAAIECRDIRSWNPGRHPHRIRPHPP